MSKIKYYIEQCDNGIVIADKTDYQDGEVGMAEVALDKDICYQLGKLIWQDIKYKLDETLESGADIELEIKPRRAKL